MGNKISLIYNAKYSEIFTFCQQDDENKLTVSVVLSRYFRCFGLFYAITVLPFILKTGREEQRWLRVCKTLYFFLIKSYLSL